MPVPVLFDLDGTLIATRRLYLEAFADALEPVLGHRPTHEEMMARRPRAEVRFLREMGGEEAHPQVMERFYRSYEARHAVDFEGIYPGVPALLAGLRARDFPVGLVTGKSRRSYRITAAAVELGSFHVTVFDDDVPSPKPDPAGLHLALERLALDPAHGIYVGDSATDMEAAAQAGLRPVAALWSKRDHEREPFARHAEKLGGVAAERPEGVLELLPRGGADGVPRETAPLSGEGASAPSVGRPPGSPGG